MSSEKGNYSADRTKYKRKRRFIVGTSAAGALLSLTGFSSQVSESEFSPLSSPTTHQADIQHEPGFSKQLFKDLPTVLITATEVSPAPLKAEIVVFDSTFDAQGKECNPEKIKCTKKRFYNKLEDIYGKDGVKVIWPSAKNIVFHESSWDYNVINSIGACYLPQAYGCEKLKKTLENRSPRDIEGQAKWMNKYVKKYDKDGKYGGWQEAWKYWQKNGSY